MRLKILFILMCACFCNATTYFIGPSGSDSNDGLSRINPFATIMKADTAVSAGDVVIVMSGTYTLTGAVTIGTDGTVSKPIKWYAEFSDVLLQCTLNTLCAIVCNGDYHEFYGFRYWANNTGDTRTFTIVGVGLKFYNWRVASYSNDANTYIIYSSSGSESNFYGCYFDCMREGYALKVQDGGTGAVYMLNCTIHTEIFVTDAKDLDVSEFVDCVFYVENMSWFGPTQDGTFSHCIMYVTDDWNGSGDAGSDEYSEWNTGSNNHNVDPAFTYYAAPTYYDPTYYTFLTSSAAYKSSIVLPGRDKGAIQYTSYQIID